MGKIPLELVYRLDVVLPVNLRLPIYKLLGQCATNQKALQQQIDRVVPLEKDRHVTFTHFMEYQAQVKRVFDRKAKGKTFKVGEIILLWDKRNEKPGGHDKFDSLWLGTYLIDVAVGPNTFQLTNLEGDHEGLPLNE
jgi:hypothetical protein